MIDKAQAIKSLNNDAEFSIREDVITWITTPISDSDITTEQERLQAAYDALEYSRLRKAKYDLRNQDEMRYDDLVNNTTTWRDGIAAIKAAHPKP